ncbi:hypothetical protein HDU92_000615 [Lobulomyces angularis]|nr:hypothetical protein HDU92_000615 [Lobulomyces angularis]
MQDIKTKAVDEIENTEDLEAKKLENYNLTISDRCITEEPEVPETLWFYCEKPQGDTRNGFPLFLENPKNNSDNFTWCRFSKIDAKKLEDCFQTQNYEKKVLLKDDYLFEADLQLMRMTAVYWIGPYFEIRRSFWFYKPVSTFIPCCKELSEQLEQGFQKLKPWKLSFDEKNLNDDQIKFKLTDLYEKQYCVFESPAGAIIHSELIASKIGRVVIGALMSNENFGGTKTLRGWNQVLEVTGSKNVEFCNDEFDEEVTSFDREINHVIFCVHGIGQNLAKKMDSMDLPVSVDQFRLLFQKSSSIIKTDHPDLNIPELGGVQVLPIQWRQQLNVYERNFKNCEEDSDEENEFLSLEDVTLPGIPSIRSLCNDVMMDLLLYMTSHHKQHMVNHLTMEINRVHTLYMEKNKDFKGKFSIFAHSLGSLLVADILANQENEILDNTNGADNEAAMKDNEIYMVEKPDFNFSENLRAIGRGNAKFFKKFSDSDIKYQKLNFDVNMLFEVGSPLGLFYFLRGNRLKGKRDEHGEDKNPSVVNLKVKAVYNIFHPHDPIAYRLEPTVNKSKSKVLPQRIKHTKGGITSIAVGINDTQNKLFSTIETLKNFGIFNKYNDVEGEAGSCKESKSTNGFENWDREIAILNPNQLRLDFSLTENVTESMVKFIIILIDLFHLFKTESLLECSTGA